MLWLLIPLMLGLMLISITQLPRAIVLSAIIEYRYFKRQPSYAKQLSTSLKTVLIATWLVLATITLSVEQHPLWSVFTLVLTASLLVGAVVDHTTGLLPFRIALIIAIGALLYTSSTFSRGYSDCSVDRSRRKFGVDVDELAQLEMEASDTLGRG